MWVLTHFYADAVYVFQVKKSPVELKTSTLLLPTSLPGGQSKREPPDPIPTSEVKPLSADDSADYLCESRELPGSNCKNPRLNRAGVFLWALFRGIQQKSSHSQSQNYWQIGREGKEKLSLKRRGCRVESVQRR